MNRHIFPEFAQFIPATIGIVEARLAGGFLQPGQPGPALTTGLVRFAKGPFQTRHQCTQSLPVFLAFQHLSVGIENTLVARSHIRQHFQLAACLLRVAVIQGEARFHQAGDQASPPVGAGLFKIMLRCLYLVLFLGRFRRQQPGHQWPVTVFTGGHQQALGLFLFTIHQLQETTAQATLRHRFFPASGGPHRLHGIPGRVAQQGQHHQRHRPKQGHQHHKPQGGIHGHGVTDDQHITGIRCHPAPQRQRGNQGDNNQQDDFLHAPPSLRFKASMAAKPFPICGRAWATLAPPISFRVVCICAARGSSSRNHCFSVLRAFSTA